MKYILKLSIIIAVLAVLACGKGKNEDNTVTFEYDNGNPTEMIELYTPQTDDTASWVLVKGKASTKQGYLEITLVSKGGEIIQRRGLPLKAKAPDTVDFEIGLTIPPDVAPQPAKIRAYTLTAHNAGKTNAAVVPLHIKPGSAPAHGTILRFYAALDTNDFKSAYKLLNPNGETYPKFYKKEILFNKRPSMTAFKKWKSKGEHFKILLLRQIPIYDLPTENLFCYLAKIEHIVDNDTSLQEKYIFLKRQPDGFFKLYKPRKDPYIAD